MSTSLLITGFGPFGSVKRNPTEAVVRSLQGRSQVSTYIFRTSFSVVFTELPRLLAQLHPDSVLMLGYAASADCVRLETLARNRSGSCSKDVDGRAAPLEVIEGGVPELPTTLPLEEIGQALRAGDVEVDLSVDAGGYVCNYGFYTLQHLAKKLGVGRSGLVHLPSTERYRARNNRDLDTHQAVEIVTTILMEG